MYGYNYLCIYFVLSCSGGGADRYAKRSQIIAFQNPVYFALLYTSPKANFFSSFKQQINALPNGVMHNFDAINNGHLQIGGPYSFRGTDAFRLLSFNLENQPDPRLALEGNLEDATGIADPMEIPLEV